MSRPGLLALLVFALAFLLYLASLAPDVLWGDLAEFQAGADRLDLEFGTRGYPLYRLLSYAASALPVGNLAYRVNLLTALCAAAAVATIFLTAARMGLKPSACFIAAATLAVSHGFWSQAVLAEVYSLHALLLAALALLLLDVRPLTTLRILATGAVLAVACFHHQTILFVYPACFVVLLIRRAEALATRRNCIATVVSLVIAALPALLLLAGGTGRSEGLTGALSGGGRSLMSRLWYAGRLTGLEFPSPALLLILLGLYSSVRRIRLPASAFLLTSTGVLLLFPLVFRWFGDQHVFLLPAFLFLSVLAGVGANRLPWRGLSSSALVAAVALMPPAVYLGLSEYFTRPGAPSPFRADKEYARCFFWPPKSGYRHPREFAEKVLKSLPPGATLICTWGEGKTALYLQEIDGLRPDVSLRLVRTGAEFQRVVKDSRFPLYVTRYPYFVGHKPPYGPPPGFRYDPHEPLATLLQIREK